MKGRYRYGSVLWVLIFMQQKRGEILACKHYLLFSSSYDYFSILFWGSTRLTADLSQKYDKNILSIRILEAGINFVQVLNFLTAVTEDLECAWRPSSTDKFSSLFWLFLCRFSYQKMVLARNWEWLCKSKFTQNTKQFGPRNEKRVKGSFVNAQSTASRLADDRVHLGRDMFVWKFVSVRQSTLESSWQTYLA